MIEIAIHIATGMLILSMIFTLLRLIKGPDLQDRVVALDLIASVVSGLILIFVFISGEVRYVDIVLVLSLIIFLGTIAIAKYLNKEE